MSGGDPRRCSEGDLVVADARVRAHRPLVEGQRDVAVGQLDVSAGNRFATDAARQLIVLKPKLK